MNVFKLCCTIPLIYEDGGEQVSYFFMTGPTGIAGSIVLVSRSLVISIFCMLLFVDMNLDDCDKKEEPQ